MKISPRTRLFGRRVAAMAAAVAVSFPVWSGPTGPGRDAASAGRAQPAGANAGAGGVRVEQTADSEPRTFGRSYGEWAAQWAAWAWSGPVGANAIADTTGAACAVNQPRGPVWFLAGTFGATGVVRNCTIPRGRALFFPLVGLGWIDCPETTDGSVPEAQVRDILASYFANPTELSTTLNGVPIVSLQVPIVRAQSPKYTSVLPDNNVVDAFQQCPNFVGAGRTGRRIDDGYWVMLPPLPAGQHTVTLRGAVGAPPFFDNSVTYNLTVTPR